jgi:anti-sigma factor RsiW
MMLFGGCPSEKTLRTFLSKRDSARVARHVEGCAECQKKLAQIRQEERVVSDLRAAESQGLDEPTRTRVYELCQRVAREESRKLTQQKPQDEATRDSS